MDKMLLCKRGVKTEPYTCTFGYVLSCAMERLPNPDDSKMKRSDLQYDFPKDTSGAEQKLGAKVRSKMQRIFRFPTVGIMRK